MLCAILGSVLSALLLLAFFTRKRVSTPGPSEYPLIQALPYILMYRGHLLQAITDMTIAFKGATWTAKWPSSPRFYFITSPANVEHILKTKFDNYVKGDVVHANLEALLGDGIFNSDGEKWHIQRKMASHMFSRREFNDNIMAVLQRHGAELDEILLQHAKSGEPINMQALFFCYTLDSIGDIAFGESIGALKNPDVPFAKAFDMAQYIVEKRFVSPGWQVLEYLNGTRSRLNRALEVMRQSAQRMIDQRRAAGDYAHRRDLLSRFMAYVDEETQEQPYLHNDKFLRDMIMNFMIAGRDTTAQALSWTIHALASADPCVEERCVAEARELLGLGASEKSLTALTYDEVVRQTPYLRATVSETLRLYPSVPKDIKQAVANDVLPDGTRVHAGDIVAYLPYAMGRLDSLWPNPTHFDPTRFLGVKHSSFKFIAFNAGLRICLGQHLAMTEASFVLAILFRRYKVTPVPGQDVQPTESLTLPMERGLMARITLRD